MSELFPAVTLLVDESPKENLNSKILFSVFILLYGVYYLFAARSRPKLYSKVSSLKNFFVEKIPMLTEVYTPMIWGFTGRVQTVLRPIFKRSSKPEYKEETITLSDGGELTLSWTTKENQSDSCPIVIILPGLTGCSCSHYIVYLVDNISIKGYRCVVINNPGTCGQKLKTPRTYSASQTNNISQVVDHIQTRYPLAPKIAVGISMGAIILFHYISLFDESTEANTLELSTVTAADKKCPLKAAMCISMPWELTESTRNLEKPVNWFLFNRYLTGLLCDIVNKNEDILSKEFDVPKILKSRSVREFDENMTANMFGFSSVEDYYNAASPATKIQRIKVPLLCLVAADDPFVPLNSIPLEEISKSSHVILVLTKHGGHIGFLDGFIPTGPNLMDRVTQYFCTAVFDNPNDLETASRKCNDLIY